MLYKTMGSFQVNFLGSLFNMKEEQEINMYSA